MKSFFFVLRILKPIFTPSGYTFFSGTYTMSLSQSAQMFCPGGRLDCGVVGCGFVSGAETGLRPVKAGDEGVATPLGV